MLKSLLQTESNYTLTENGALTHRSTKSYVLDLFALGGSAKSSIGRDLIANALYEDSRTALKVIFYLSDIREGQGRRDFFRTSLLYILSQDKELARKLLPYVAEFGRWDYLYWFMGTSLESEALLTLEKEVEKCLTNKTTSLVFKWLASEDASSEETKRNAEITRRAFGLTRREYRKMLSWGRKALGDAVVEHKMSTNLWEDIDHSKVPSVAMKKYRKAFISHIPNKFTTFVGKVEKGEAKINSKVLYPHDIVHAGEYTEGVERRALAAQWNALPNYLSDNVRALAVVDTSGSMSGQPLEIASSIGIYLAERMVGEFKNTIVSFSSEARLFDVSHGDVFDKYNFLKRNTINDNTNLQSVFNLLLRTALKHNVSANEMPNRIIIMSDMEFDRATGPGWNDYGRRGADTTNLDEIRRKYAVSGYEFPQIIFWNVDARNTQVPTTMNDKGVILVSGYSPVVVKSVLSDDPYITPYRAMLEAVNVERYAFIDKL
jgi:hypothetical protein